MAGCFSCETGEKDLVVRMALVGPSGAGSKTSFLYRFLTGSFVKTRSSGYVDFVNLVCKVPNVPT